MWLRDHTLRSESKHVAECRTKGSHMDFTKIKLSLPFGVWWTLSVFITYEDIFSQFAPLYPSFSLYGICSVTRYLFYPPHKFADLSGRVGWGVSQWLLDCWDCGFQSHRGHGCLSVLSFVCYQVEVCATGWSLFQRSPIECDREALVVLRPWPIWGCSAMTKQRIY